MIAECQKLEVVKTSFQFYDNMGCEFTRESPEKKTGNSMAYWTDFIFS